MRTWRVLQSLMGRAADPGAVLAGGAEVVPAPRSDGAVLAALMLGLYVLTRFPALPPVGDAADYVQLVAHGIWDRRAAHVGYYVLARPSVLLGQLGGMTPIAVLTLLAAACTAASGFLLHRLLARIGLGRGPAAAAAFVYGTAGLTWYHALFPELQALLLLLILLAYWAMLAERPILSGAAAATGLLVSQAAAVALPALGALWLIRRRRSEAIRCGVAATLVFGIGVAAVVEEYFNGSRGVGPSLGYYQPASISRTLALLALRLLESHTILVLLLPLGLVVAWRRARLLLWWGIAILLPHLWAAARVGHVEYGFVWMPFLLWTSTLIGLGLTAGGGRVAGRTTAVGLAGAAAAAAWFAFIQPKRQDANEFARVVDEAAALVGQRRLVAQPHVGFVFMQRTAPGVPDVWRGQWLQPRTTPAEWSRLLGEADTLAVLEYRPDPQPIRAAIVRLAGNAAGWPPERTVHLAREIDDDLVASLEAAGLARRVDERRWTTARLVHVVRWRVSAGSVTAAEASPPSPFLPAPAP